MADVISTEIRQLTLNKQRVYVSVITYNELIPDEDIISTIVANAYQTVAEELLNKADFETQKSACLITNLCPIQAHLTKEAIETWYENATEDSLQTQRMLYQVFKRPTFSIVTLPGIDEMYVRKQESRINPNANPTHVVNSFDEAMELAQQLMTVVHN